MQFIDRQGDNIPVLQKDALATNTENNNIDYQSDEEVVDDEVILKKISK